MVHTRKLRLTESLSFYAFIFPLSSGWSITKTVKRAKKYKDYHVVIVVMKRLFHCCELNIYIIVYILYSSLESNCLIYYKILENEI